MSRLAVSAFGLALLLTGPAAPRAAAFPGEIPCAVGPATYPVPAELCPGAQRAYAVFARLRAAAGFTEADVRFQLDLIYEQEATYDSDAAGPFVMLGLATGCSTARATAPRSSSKGARRAGAAARSRRRRPPARAPTRATGTVGSTSRRISAA